MKPKLRSRSRFVVAAIAGAGTILGVGTVLGVGTTLGGSSIASAVDDAPLPLTLSPPKAKPGDPVTLSGPACLDDETMSVVTVTLPYSPDVDAASQDAFIDVATDHDKETGAWSYHFVVPKGQPAGQYTVTATCATYGSVSGNWEGEVVGEVLADTAAPVVSVDSSSVAAGGKLTVSGQGFQAGEKVSVTIHSDPVKLGELTADNAGKVSGSFVIPASITAGEHRIELVGMTSGFKGSTAVTVKAATEVITDPPTPTDPGAPPTDPGTPPTDPVVTSKDRLAFTGGSAAALGTGALLAIVAGAAITIASRRREGARAR